MTTENKSPPQHTPGPWHTEKSSAEWIYILSTHGIVGSAWATDETYEVNARIIAAAPDLLNALECLEIFMLDTMPEDASLDVWTQAREAIAKAIGEA
jgi:hypothetical protein